MFAWIKLYKHVLNEFLKNSLLYSNSIVFKIGVCFSWGLKKKKRCGQTVETKGQQMDNWLMNSADDLLGFTDASNGIGGIGGGWQNVERPFPTITKWSRANVPPTSHSTHQQDNDPASQIRKRRPSFSWFAAVFVSEKFPLLSRVH